MSIFALSCFITGIVAGLTGLFVFLKERKQRLNQIWCFLNFAIAIWMFGLGGALAVNDQNLALFCQRILYIGTILIPILFLQFCIVLIEREKERKFITLLKINTLLVIVFTSSLFIGDFFIKYVKNQTYFGYWPVEVGWLYYQFLLWFALIVIYAFFLLRRHIKREINAIKRKQISIIFYGTLIGFIAGSVNFLLDFDIVFPPFHNLFVISYLFFVALAVIRYRLFNLRVILTEILVGVIALILLIKALIAPTFWWRVFGFGLLVLFGIVGYLLIKSVLAEIKRREEMESLSSKLATANIKLEAAYKKLEKLNKAKSEFLSIASHQLRTPLTAIKGYLSMVLENAYGKPPEKMERPLENIYVSSERLIKLVNDLLSVTRIETGRMETKLEQLSLEEIIINVVEELKNEAKKKDIYLKWEEPKEPLPKISADREKIRQVILNIVDNAIKYSNRGYVSIAANPKLEIRNSKPKVIIIKVRDTGAGMTKEELSKLFESFSRGTAGNRLYTEGVGLGLYISRKFVEMHNGRIWVESEGRGKGAAFYIELPVKCFVRGQTPHSPAQA